MVEDKFIIDSLKIKGVTIILMFCNHLFPIMEWIYEENMYISTSFFGKNIASYIGGFGKICVSVFAFLTGVGLYYIFQRDSFNNIENMMKYSINKLIDFLVRFWVVLFLLFIPVIKIYNGYTYDFYKIFQNMIAFDTSIIKVSWYVRFYISLMITLPIIFIILKKIRYKYIDFVFLVFVIILNYMTNEKDFKYLAEYFNYLMIVVCGYIYEKRGVFRYYNSIISGSILKCSCLMLSIFIMRGITKSITFINTDIIYVPIYCYCVSVFLGGSKNFIQKWFEILGRYSLQLWFIHAIFFIGNSKVQKIAYWPKLDLFILIWTIIITLPIAIILDKISNMILKQFKNLKVY